MDAPALGARRLRHLGDGAGAGRSRHDRRRHPARQHLRLDRRRQKLHPGQGLLRRRLHLRGQAPGHADHLRSGRQGHAVGRRRDRRRAPLDRSRPHLEEGGPGHQLRGHPRRRGDPERIEARLRHDQPRPERQPRQWRDLRLPGTRLALAVHPHHRAPRRRRRDGVPHQRQRPAGLDRPAAAQHRPWRKLEGRQAAGRAQLDAVDGGDASLEPEADLRLLRTSASSSARPTAARAGPSCRASSARCAARSGSLCPEYLHPHPRGGGAVSKGQGRVLRPPETRYLRNAQGEWFGVAVQCYPLRETAFSRFTCFVYFDCFVFRRISDVSGGLPRRPR